MKYEEIEATLKEAGFNAVIERLRVAVGEEADALFDAGVVVGTTLEERIAQSREYYAESITDWLSSGDGPDPEMLLCRRARYTNSWAFARIIAKLQVDENDEDECIPIDDNALLRICEANSQLGLHLVETMRENRALSAAAKHSVAVTLIREALDAAYVVNMNLLGNRKLEVWERVEALLIELVDARAQLARRHVATATVVHQTSRDAVTAIELDFRKTVENLVGVAKIVHAGHHKRPGLHLGNWWDCSEGVCGSMGHMLAQVGLTKQLQSTERVP